MLLHSFWDLGLWQLPQKKREENVAITICHYHNIIQHEYGGIYHIILSILQNIVMDPNNVMLVFVVDSFPIRPSRLNQSHDPHLEAKL